MSIKRKMHKSRIRTFIKTNGILHTSRCTVIQIETELQCIVSNVEFSRNLAFIAVLFL